MSAPPASFALAVYRPDAPPDPATLAALTRVERAALGTARPGERAAAILAAKRALGRILPGLGPLDVEILRRQWSAPRVLVHGIAVPVRVSLSHAGGLAVAGVLAGADIACGR
jgi:hypothetical protein